jgi:transcriptional regulator with XRE-family HTH domain
VSDAENPENPPVARRELGALLRALRTEAGLTVDDVADRLMCSATKVSRMETGQRGVSARDVRDLCQIYAITDDTEYRRLMELAAQGRAQAWWQPFNLPYATYVGLETAATSIRDYASGIVPGLLQTADYARAVHENGIPTLEPEVVEERVRERLSRQRILTSTSPPRVHIVMDEAAIRRAVGGPAVMVEQLDRLLEATGALPNLVIQVLPFSVGAHPALNANFVLLDLSAPAGKVVYVEGLVDPMYLERPQEVRKYEKVFDWLSRLALPPAASADLLRQAKADLATGLSIDRQGEKCA